MTEGRQSRLQDAIDRGYDQDPTHAVVDRPTIPLDQAAENLRRAAALPQPTVTPRTWAEGRWPTEYQLTAWLERCTHEERLAWAKAAIEHARRSLHCQGKHWGMGPDVGPEVRS